MTDPRKFIKRVRDVKEEIINNYENGSAKGETTFIPDIDAMFKWKRTFMNVLTGYQSHGKSQWLAYICLAKSIGDNSKWAFFTPEGNAAADWYEELIHCLAGQTTDKDYDQIGRERLEWAMEFVDRHFFFVEPPTGQHEDVLAAFKYLNDTEGIFGCIIDGFNSLSFEIHAQEYLSIRSFLIKQRNFTNENNITSIIVVHPKNPSTNHQGEVPEPDTYSLSGGAEWANKACCVLSFNRPRFFSDRLDTSCYIKTLKMKKQKIMALPGQCNMTFDRIKNRYLFNGRDPLQDLINKKLSNPLQPSSDYLF